jgi:hypothetical protein
MANRQQRSNRERKKPKADKNKTKEHGAGLAICISSKADTTNLWSHCKEDGVRANAPGGMQRLVHFDIP